MAHQIVVLKSRWIWRAWHIGIGGCLAIVLFIARKYPQYNFFRIPGRNPRNDRQISMHIRAPVFADTDQVGRVRKSPQPFCLLVREFHGIVGLLKQFMVPPNAGEVLFPRVTLRESFGSDYHLPILYQYSEEGTALRQANAPEVRFDLRIFWLL